MDREPGKQTPVLEYESDIPHMPAATAAGRQLSLAGLHSTVAVPLPSAGFWRHYLAFVGPALLVSVGYMDPGNWGTDLLGGSKYQYQLVWVLLMSNLMALLLQSLAIRLGVVTGKGLARAWRAGYPR